MTYRLRIRGVPTPRKQKNVSTYLLQRRCAKRTTNLGEKKLHIFQRPPSLERAGELFHFGVELGRKLHLV